MKYWLFLCLLMVPAACAAQVVEVPMEKGWRATPEWAAFEKAESMRSAFQEGVATFRASGGGRIGLWTCNPTPRLDVRKMHFVSLRYRLFDTDPSLYSYLLYADTGDSGGMYARNLVFGANDLIHDGEWHTATTTLHPFEEIGTMALRIRALEGREGRLDVAYLRFSEAPPRNGLSEVIRWQAGTDGLTGEAIALDTLRKETLPQAQAALALGEWFPGEDAVVEGVNFRVPVAGPVAAATSVKGVERLAVPVGRKAAGLYLLMGAQFPYKMLGYEGWAPGDMTDRPEQFHVTLRYADGSEEEQVPYCLGQRRYGVWRGLQAYALPVAAGKTVREIELHDGMVYSAFHLVAVTMAGTSLAPQPADAPLRTPAGIAPRAVAPAVSLRGNRLTARTGAGDLVFDLAKGISLVAATNVRHPKWRVKVEPLPLFSVKEGQKVWPGDGFLLDGKVTVAARTALATFTSREAGVSIALAIEARAEDAAIRVRVKNLSDQPRTLDVTLPQVRVTLAETAVAQPAGSSGKAGAATAAGRPAGPSAGAVVPAGADDLWYFYPAMCAVWSNQDGAYDTVYSGYFPVQFQDVYDRRSGGGLAVGTRDTSLRQRYFGMTKAQGAATMRIEYRFNPPLPAGEWVEYPMAVLAPHGGDWRPALEAYQRWFASWHKPQRPRIGWYQGVWNFRTWWTHTMGDGRAEHNLFDPKTKEFQTDAYLKRDREQFGAVDMVHFFDWRISKQYGRYGDFSHYEDIGGLEKFRGMVGDLKRQGVRVGLYLDCYLCSRKSLVGQAHGKEWALLRQDGRVGDNYSSPEDPMLNMCVNHPGWQDHMAQTCARVARETGCDGVYLDEGMTDLGGYWCWSKEHGHPVPGTNQAGLLEMARKVRAALPANVALYTEWSPADVFIPHLDGAYQASLRHSEAQASPGFLQTARFVFPDFRVLTISNGGSMADGIWEGTKYNLFNGVPLYSLSWGHDDACLPLFRKMSAILHEHADAFNTRRPIPWVETERGEVYCNEFAGARETVWTLRSGRYRTLDGPLLRVKHVPGARYVDLWNGKPLKPVVAGGLATLAVRLGPRGIGAVAQVRQ